MLFHLIGALSEFGKLGLTAIANSREEVDDSTGARLWCWTARPCSGIRAQMHAPNRM